MINEHKDIFVNVLDCNGLNVVLYCIQHFSWDCLTAVINTIGHESLNVADESINCDAKSYAKLIGFEAAYLKWHESTTSGVKYDWSQTLSEDQSKTLVMFNGKYIIQLYHIFRYIPEACRVQ